MTTRNLIHQNSFIKNGILLRGKVDIETKSGIKNMSIGKKINDSNVYLTGKQTETS